jgi:hypothetical protein
MIANSAFLAAMLLILLVFWLMGQLEFLVPYKHVVFGEYLWIVVGAGGLVFLHLLAVSYVVTRRVFLKDTGRKLAHVERQLQTADTVVRDLSERLAREE